MNIDKVNLSVFKSVLRVLWAITGLFFIWFDINKLGNTEINPTVWMVLGLLCVTAAAIGLVGGVGAALVAQGLLTYKANTFLLPGSIKFAETFSNFDKAAHAIFIAYGCYLIYKQIRKNFRQA